MDCYRFSPDVFVEHFDDDAILFLAHRDLMFTVNHAAGLLYETARSVVGGRPFSRRDCTDFLVENYELPIEEACRQANSLLSFGLRHRILVKGENP
jgi:hypothetical protein